MLINLETNYFWQIITHHINTVLKLISCWQFGEFWDVNTTEHAEWEC